MRRPRAHSGTRPGPPKNHPGPTGPCQEPPKSPKGRPRAAKRASEGSRGRQESPRRASGGARRALGGPKNFEKRYTVDEIWLFSRERLWSRPGGSKSRPGGAKRAPGAAQEPPRAPQGGPREVQERPTSRQERPRGAPRPPRRAQGAARDRPVKRAKISFPEAPRGPPKGAEEASKRPPQHARRYCRETAMLPKTIPQTDKRSFRTHEGRGHFTRRQLTSCI